MHKWDFRNTYYLIIQCVRGWELWDMLDLKTPVGVRRGEVRCIFGAFFWIKKKPTRLKINILQVYFCGERGIRTPGTFQYVGFQDRCNRPLCHLSKSCFFNENVVSFRLMMQRYIKKVNRASVLAKKLKIFFLFCVFVGFCSVFVSFFVSFPLFGNRKKTVCFTIAFICQELFLCGI